VPLAVNDVLQGLVWYLQRHSPGVCWALTVNDFLQGLVRHLKASDILQELAGH
jgi:hypothetical protein